MAVGKLQMEGLEGEGCGAHFWRSAIGHHGASQMKAMSGRDDTVADKNRKVSVRSIVERMTTTFIMIWFKSNKTSECIVYSVWCIQKWTQMCLGTACNYAVIICSYVSCYASLR